MKHLLLFSLFLILSVMTSNAQTVELTVLDEIDWVSPPSILANSSYYLLSRKGNVIETGTYRNGKKHGTFLYFMEGSGLNREETYKNGYLDGFYLKVSSKGTEQGRYAHGKKTGVWVFSNNSQKEEFTYINNVRNGSYSLEDYVLNMKTTGQYLNDKKDGIWIYYEKKDGECKELYKEKYENGILVL